MSVVPSCKNCIHRDFCNIHGYIDADECGCFKDKADFVEVKKIEIIRDDLKWWLVTNTEKGVVHIPEYVIENMIAKMGGERK